MSRSYRYSPFTGNSFAESEKQDKRRANRRQRRMIRESMTSEFDGLVLPDIREVSNAAAFRKDGKQHITPATQDYERLMRK